MANYEGELNGASLVGEVSNEGTVTGELGFSFLANLGVMSVNGKTGTVTLDNTDVGAAATSHNHTKSQITDFAHTHDDRYYTESETDTLLGGKANATHTHTKSQITDFPSIPSKTSDLVNDSGFLTEHQSLSAYRTSSAQDVIDETKADKSTTYTKSETDTLLNAKSTVSVSAYGSVSNEVEYITVDDVEYKLKGGSASSISWDNITDKPSTFTPSAHNHTKSEITDFAHTHDDRYYTESETDTLLSSKLSDAPRDNKSYARKNGAWSEVTGGSSVPEYEVTSTQFENILNGTVMFGTMEAQSIAPDLLDNDAIRFFYSTSETREGVTITNKKTLTVRKTYVDKTSVSASSGAVYYVGLVGEYTSSDNNLTTQKVWLGASYISYNGIRYIMLLKGSIPAIPTKTSQLTNDSGFLTSHQDISGKENISNKVTTVSSSSTDTEYPSAKCVYDYVDGVKAKTVVLSNIEYNYIDSPTSFIIETPSPELADAFKYETRVHFTSVFEVEGMQLTSSKTYIKLWNLIADGATEPLYTAWLSLKSDDVSGNDEVGITYIMPNYEGTGAIVGETEQLQKQITSENKLDYSLIANKPTIPTKTSDLTNDSGFITSHQDISGKEDKSSKVTSLSSASTDVEYPSAKCVYDIVGNVESLLEALL